MIPGQLAVDHRPGHHEDRFHVEQDEQHGHHVKAHAEAPAGIAHGLNSALVGGQLGGRVAMPPDEPGGRQPSPAQAEMRQESASTAGDIASNKESLPPSPEKSGKIASGPPGPPTAPQQQDAWFEIRFSASSRQGKPGAALHRGPSGSNSESASAQDRLKRHFSNDFLMVIEVILAFQTQELDIRSIEKIRFCNSQICVSNHRQFISGEAALS